MTPSGPADRHRDEASPDRSENGGKARERREPGSRAFNSNIYEAVAAALNGERAVVLCPDNPIVHITIRHEDCCPVLRSGEVVGCL